MTYKEQHTNNNTTAEHQATTSSFAATTTTGSSVNTRPGVHYLSPQDYETIRQAYVEILGNLNIWKARDIELAINDGMQVGAILEAIEQTAMARKPSHYYFRAILKRYQACGLLTAADVLRDREQRAHERYEANSAQWSAWYTNPNDLPY